MLAGARSSYRHSTEIILSLPSSNVMLEMHRNKLIEISSYCILLNQILVTN